MVRMWKTYDDRGAGDLRHFAESIVMVVIGRAEVRLASGQSCFHLDVKESILHSKAFLLRCKIFYPSLIRLDRRAKESVTFLISL